MTAEHHDRTTVHERVGRKEKPPDSARRSGSSLASPGHHKDPGQKHPAPSKPGARAVRARIQPRKG